jgi:hypothetical protein
LQRLYFDAKDPPRAIALGVTKDVLVTLRSFARREDLLGGSRVGASLNKHLATLAVIFACTASKNRREITAQPKIKARL